MTTVQDYVELWEDVLSARREVAQTRNLPRGQPATTAARTGLLRALEAYTESLDSRGRPVPYQLRHELRLARLTQGH